MATRNQILTEPSNNWNIRYVNVLTHVKANIFIAQVIVYQSALSLEKWNKLFKWPPILLLAIPTTIQAYTSENKWWTRVLSLGTLFASITMKSWHQSKGYEVNIEKFKNIYDELNHITDEINFVLAKDDNNSTKPSPDEFISKIIERFAEIRKKIPIIPKHIHDMYFGTQNIEDVYNIYDLLNKPFNSVNLNNHANSNEFVHSDEPVNSLEFAQDTSGNPLEEKSITPDVVIISKGSGDNLIIEDHVSDTNPETIPLEPLEKNTSESYSLFASLPTWIGYPKKSKSNKLNKNNQV